MSFLALFLGCSPDPAPPTPLVDLPVGVRTERVGERTLEVWYPSIEVDAPTEWVDFSSTIPGAVTDKLGKVSFPPIPTIAVRDAAIRPTDAPYPVIVFSHGLGGSRTQSPGFATHLASTGFVVVAADHAGRTLNDLLPCLFLPALEGCDLTATLVTDPGLVDVPAIADWAEEAERTGWLAGQIDAEHLGLSGHSLGAGTTTRVGEVDDRFLALLPMAGADPVTRDVPELVMGGSCDGVIAIDQLAANASSSAHADFLPIPGAGHLAFSDMCTLRFDQFYVNHLEGRADLNDLFVDLLVALSADGCPFGAPSRAVCDDGAYLDLATSTEIIGTSATSFFAETLRP